ncbi:CARDB domain-containing protein [Methanobacterium sp.]|uniref:CARDB domain-containing protein n=1 Tax=Methanobacterium sp. TaxID=2164 RepID=UPI0031582A4E
MKRQLLILIIFSILALITCETASASPDLAVTSVNVTSNVSPGSTVTINDTVTNQGDQAADGFTVGYYIQDEYAVVKKPASQRNASIYGDKVVWSDYRYDRQESDLYYKNITGTEDGVIYTPGDQLNPAIYGDVIVWQENLSWLGNSHWQILGYNIPGRDDPINDSIYLLYNTTSDQINPSIYQDKIVWQQQRSDGSWDIYLYDFPITDDIAMPKEKWITRITKDGANHINPYVNGNYIVWQQDNGDGIWNIYTYDLSTGDINRVCQSSENQTNPALYGDNVVWQQYNTTSKNWDIYMYDLSADEETQITHNTSNHINPAIYGDKIVWQDNRNGNWDIYMYDLTLGIERQLTIDKGNQINPAIYDNKVVWTDDRNSNEDIYMTDDLTLAPEYTRYVSGLAAGKSDSALTNITLPSDLKANVNYYILVMADAAYDNSVSESNENNNIKFSGAMIVPDADLTMPSVSGPATAQTGGSMVVVNTVKNIGTKNSNPFHVYFYLSKDGTTLNTKIGSRFVSGGLKAGASNTAYTNLTIPSNIFGSYYIVAVVDPLNKTCETNKLNNIVASSTTTNICAPDLVITSISTGTTTYKRGDKITIQNTVKNQGSSTSKGFYVNFYLSNDSTITTSDTYLGQRYISGGLNAGISNTEYTNFTIPYDASGNYYIGAIVDSTNTVFESDESNNIKAFSTTIEVCSPDLVITSISTGTTTYKRGDKITIQNTVKNQGKIASGGFYVNFYLSNDSNITTSDTYLGQRYISGLNAGASNTTTTSFTVPSSLSGNYYIGAIVDSTNAVFESDESNNIATYSNTINVVLPDLVASSVSAGSTSYRRGSKMTIKNTVKNQGKVSSGGFYVKIYIYRSYKGKITSIYLGRRYISSLKAGASNTAYTKLTIPSTIAKGLYYCKMVVDTENKVSESSKSNNVISSGTWVNIF